MRVIAVILMLSLSGCASPFAQCGTAEYLSNSLCR